MKCANCGRYIDNAAVLSGKRATCPKCGAELERPTQRAGTELLTYHRLILGLGIACLTVGIGLQVPALSTSESGQRLGNALIGFAIILAVADSIVYRKHIRSAREKGRLEAAESISEVSSRGAGEPQSATRTTEDAGAPPIPPITPPSTTPALENKVAEGKIPKARRSQLDDSSLRRLGSRRISPLVILIGVLIIAAVAIASTLIAILPKDDSHKAIGLINKAEPLLSRSVEKWVALSPGLGDLFANIKNGLFLNIPDKILTPCVSVCLL